MTPNQEQPAFDHSKADFTKDGPRRVHMEEFFRHLGLWNPDQAKAIRKNFGNANVSFDDHPWPLPMSATPPMKDFSHGVCRFYQGWLLGHQSTREPQGESSEALKSEDLSKDTVTPGLAPAQPAEVTEISTCQTVPTQAKVAAPTKTEPDSRTASLATKTVAEMASSPANSTVNSAQFAQSISDVQVLKEEVAGLKEQMRKQQIEIERLKRAR
ncbi:hypothetical protein BFJ63_vAg11563 [Fusarium oxysporum f. sp. narcissi]|uniref:Uncharacterized protein n=1 Tax=Fusarium oxysporum f. sp. narcissi TaxID=451672 RepID=A0A4Q2VIQ0_FUSOX|nr:hypothetical protein BFJ63_vAg11563 [Fusarium oxysporum f. sp. narcissi]